MTVRNAQSGVLNDGTVTVTNCVLSDNLYDGLYSYEGETIVRNCVVSGNSSSGLFNDVYHVPNNPIGGHCSMIIADSIISDNSGNGIVNYWFVTILNSTFSGNSAGPGYACGGISSGTFKTPGSG